MALGDLESIGKLRAAFVGGKGSESIAKRLSHGASDMTNSSTSAGTQSFAREAVKSKGIDCGHFREIAGLALCETVNGQEVEISQDDIKYYHDVEGKKEEVSSFDANKVPAAVKVIVWLVKKIVSPVDGTGDFIDNTLLNQM